MLSILLSTKCGKCDSLSRIGKYLKIKWPENNHLKEMVWKTPVSSIAKNLGVSDKAIAKRCKKLGISVPFPGYWTKRRTGGGTEVTLARGASASL